MSLSVNTPTNDFKAYNPPTSDVPALTIASTKCSTATFTVTNLPPGEWWVEMVALTHTGECAPRVSGIITNFVDTAPATWVVAVPKTESRYFRLAGNQYPKPFLIAQ